MKTKTTAAIIKKTIDFSKDTRSAAFNKFSEYVAGGRTLADLEKNAAKFGYKVQENKNITNCRTLSCRYSWHSRGIKMAL